MKARFSSSCDRSWVKMAASRRYLSKNKPGDWMIKQLSVIHNRFYTRLSWWITTLAILKLLGRLGQVALWECFGEVMASFLGLTRLRRELGQNFSLQNSPMKHFVTTPSQSSSIVTLKCPMIRDGQLPRDSWFKGSATIQIVQGHPTTIFGKLSVRKTIGDLEFSDHFL